MENLLPQNVGSTQKGTDQEITSPCWVGLYSTCKGKGKVSYGQEPPSNYNRTFSQLSTGCSNLLK